jgi:hypothetical protein
MNLELPIVLTKKRSPQYIVYMADPWMNEDDDDPDWFVRVSYRKTNNHQEKKHSIIIKKDLEVWVNSDKRNGFIIDENFDKANFEKTKFTDDYN